MKRQIGKMLTGTLVLTLACAGAVAANVDTASAKVTVKKVAVDAPYSSTVYVAKGKKIKLATTVTVKPDKAKNKKVTFKSANKKVAAVSTKGVVKGVKTGKTKITVISKKNKKKKKTIRVAVVKKAVTKVKLNNTRASLAVGAKTTLKATLKPSKNASKQVAWKSSNKKVATVTAKGVVKGVGEGSATITCTAADGSRKKATCKVTVGAGIASVSVPHTKVVRVKLSCAKKLTAEQFDVRNKITPSGKYMDASKRTVESIKTSDNISYDVMLADDSKISDESYVKVTISSLVTDKEKEVYVGKIPGYGAAGTNNNIYITGYAVGDTFQDSWIIENSNAVGNMTYSVTGLPSGLTAYVSENKRGIRVVGTFNSVLNGATATLTGEDETGKKYTTNYKFYVGDEKTIVFAVEPINGLSYTIDNPATAKDEESGSYINGSSLEFYSGGNCYRTLHFKDYIHVSGGKSGSVSLSYDSSSIKTTDENTGDKIAIPANTYNVIVTATADSDSRLTRQFNLPIKLVDGVTVSGVVKDAAGIAASYVTVRGETRVDENGRNQLLSAVTEEDGTYSARVLPGDYYVTTIINYEHFLDSIGNNFTANTTKNISLPVYKVNFTTGISGAIAYSMNETPYFYKSTGDGYYIRTISDNNSSNYGQMYAYLKKGTYSFESSTGENDNNTIRAYSKLTEYVNSKTNQKTYRLDIENRITQNNMSLFKVSGTFTVPGTNPVKLNTVPFALASDAVE